MTRPILTYEQLLELLEVAETPGKKRNWSWLIAWLDGKRPQWDGRKTGTLTATPENVIMVYKNDDNWKEWKEEMEGHVY